MEDQGGILDAIRMAAVAGKLRAASREHGGLQGLETLADAYSERAKAALGGSQAGGRITLSPGRTR